MSQLRVNFLNWKPDFDDFPNDGLAEAKNVLHEPEGYKPVHLMDTTATTGGLASISSIVAKPFGSQDDLFCAWVSGNTLHVGVNGVTATSNTTGYPLSFTGTPVTTPEITFFDVCESNGIGFFVAEAQALELVTTTPLTQAFLNVRVAGYATI